MTTEDKAADVIEAVLAEPKETTEVFIVMVRYGSSYWSACSTWPTLCDAQLSVGGHPAVDAWKIVRVAGLPVAIPEGEAK